MLKVKKKKTPTHTPLFLSQKAWESKSLTSASADLLSRPVEKRLSHPTAARDQTKGPGSGLIQGSANMRPQIRVGTCGQI